MMATRVLTECFGGHVPEVAVVVTDFGVHVDADVAVLLAHPRPGVVAGSGPAGGHARFRHVRRMGTYACTGQAKIGKVTAGFGSRTGSRRAVSAGGAAVLPEG